jgi:hypothetical protein
MDECVVCLDELVGWHVKTVCACSRAYFCCECWHRWIESSQIKCPLCRTIIDAYSTRNETCRVNDESLVALNVRVDHEN